MVREKAFGNAAKNVVNGSTLLSEQDELSQLNSGCTQAAIQLERIERLIAAMKAEDLSNEDLLDVCPELKEAYTRNEKLKYRKQILEKSVATQSASNKAMGTNIAPVTKKSKLENSNEKKVKEDTKLTDKVKAAVSSPKLAQKYEYVTVEDYGSSIIGRLSDVFKKSIKEAYPSINVPLALTECQNPKFGDYQCNSAMAIANKLKATGVQVRPAQVAEEIKKHITTCPLVEKIDVVPAGFINIFLSKKFIQQQVGNIAANGIQLPRVARKRVVVDFSSPNVAKEMHVGHLRSTIIGESICRLFEIVGFEVLRLNHIGDWGTQFGMLVAHLQDRFPNFLTETPPISDLQTFYKESKKRFDEDSVFKARAYQCVVKLQNYESDIVKGWQLICDVSRKYIAQIYERLDISIQERGESFYQSRMVNVVEELKAGNFLTEEDGRLVMFPTGCEVPLTVVKSDGGNTYDTSDLAALKQRLFEEKADWCIYVIDSGQSLHIETIFAAARDLKWYDPSKQRVEHVGFGLVLGEDKKKFKTRSGDTVRLIDLLDEGVKKAEAKLVEKERNKVMSEDELVAARDAVAYGCIKYADLSHTRTMDYVFSFDRMLDDRGNTAVYLLYAYARINSIVRTSGVSEKELSDWISAHPSLPLEHPSELKLAKAVLKLSDAVLNVLDSLMLHPMCDYVYQLSTIFSDFYKDCYVIEKKDGETTIHYQRLALCDVTARVMQTCFKILGIKEVAKM